jgi:hypothetical protein
MNKKDRGNRENTLGGIQLQSMRPNNPPLSCGLTKERDRQNHNMNTQYNKEKEKEHVM